MKITRFLALTLGLTSAFAAEETTDEPEKTISYWTAGVSKESGWNDINKTILDDGEFAAMEDSMCYAASAANIIAWWQNGEWQDDANGFKPNPSAPNTLDSIWAQYVGNNANPDDGGEALSAINWWISGIYEPLDKNNWWAKEDDELWERYYQSYGSVFDDDSTEQGSLTLKPLENNGYYYDQYGLTQSDLSALLQQVWVEEESANTSATSIDFKALLESGAALSLGVCDDDELAHALTLWGAEYDKDGNLVKLWLTDSDDGDKYAGETILGINVTIDKENDKIYLGLDYGENPYIAGVYAFNAPVTKSWQMVPEPTTATLSLLALAALAARRRRK